MRLIDADALMKKADWFEYQDEGGDWCAFEFICIDDLENAPTVDAVEVVHGRWILTEEPLGWRDVDCIECSACHESWIIDEDYCIDDFSGWWKHCPNCGAKMDGEDNGRI